MESFLLQFFGLFSTATHSINVKIYNEVIIIDNNKGIKRILLAEYDRRKEKAIKELETITEATKNVKVADKRKYIALQSKIKKLEKELENSGKNKDRVIAVMREELKQLNSDEEIKSLTEYEPEEVIPDSVSYDILEFTKVKEGTEIMRLQGVNNFDEKPVYLTKDVKGELYIDE